jgi:prevent-host-death family protein
MKSVNIGTLKNELSAYLRYVRDGEEVVVRDRNVPVARIVPFRTVSVTEEEAALAAKGILKLPEKEMDWDAFWALPRPEVSDEAMKEAIKWAKGER